MRRRAAAVARSLGPLVVILAGIAPVGAADFGGFAQVNYAARVTGMPCGPGGPCDFLLGDERLQLKAEGVSDQGGSGFAAKVDLFQDAVQGRTGIEVREVYVDLSGKYAALRVGRQIVTWGVGDLLFANDIFPKDWVALFTGRPMEYLKLGSDALKVDLHPGGIDAEIVVMPLFQPDRYPTPDRLLLPDLFLPGLPRLEERKDRSLDNVEWAGKLSRYVSDWGLSLYGARTFHRSPAMAPSDSAAPSVVYLFYPRLNTYGASATGSFLGGVAGLEGAYLDSEKDRPGTNPAIENSMVKTLAAYSSPLWRDATLGLQGYLEWLLDYDAYRATLPAGTPPHDERRWLATLRFTQLLRNQTLTMSLFAFWGITDQDGYLIPSIRYAATDNVWLEAGGNIFVGRDAHTVFGALD
ncbi:MAG: hypothetical protein A2W26_11770, partial [Acidobacteria bacterium RBG_16_64_8]